MSQLPTMSPFPTDVAMLPCRRLIALNRNSLDKRPRKQMVLSVKSLTEKLTECLNFVLHHNRNCENVSFPFPISISYFIFGVTFPQI